MLHVAISAKSLQCTDFDTHNGWIEWLSDNLSFRFTGKDKNCCKHLTIDMHYYEREKHTCWLLYLFVWLIHVQPLRFASWWGLKQEIQQNQLSSLLNQVSAKRSINLRVSYSLIHRNLITQTRKCSITLPSHTQSLHSSAVSLHKFLERSDPEWFYTDLDINKDLVHKIYSISYMYQSIVWHWPWQQYWPWTERYILSEKCCITCKIQTSLEKVNV